MNDVAISVIIPVYNAEKFLDDVFQSLLNQESLADFKIPIFEVILIDDGSTDNSLRICRDFQKHYYSRTKVIHQKNVGQIKARLNGVFNAEGEYCTFLDADDRLNSKAIATIYRAMKRTMADIIIYNGSWDKDGKKELIWPDYKETECLFNDDDLKQFRCDVIRSSRFNNIVLKAFKRNLFSILNQINLPSYVRLAEDLLMQLPLFDVAKSVAYIPENLYEYRINESSVTHSFVPNMYAGSCYVNDQLLFYGEKWGVDNYEMYCNQRFMGEVIFFLKRINKQRGKWTKEEEKQFVLSIVNDNRFRKVYRSKNYNLNFKQSIYSFCAYHKLLRILMFIIYTRKADDHCKLVGFDGDK